MECLGNVFFIKKYTQKQQKSDRFKREKKYFL